MASPFNAETKAESAAAPQQSLLAGAPREAQRRAAPPERPPVPSFGAAGAGGGSRGSGASARLEGAVAGVSARASEKVSLKKLVAQKDSSPDFAVQIWNDETVVQAMVESVKGMAARAESRVVEVTIRSIDRASAALALFQCIVSHPLTRVPFISRGFCQLVLPLVNLRPTEEIVASRGCDHHIFCLSMTALGVFAALLKCGDPMDIEDENLRTRLVVACRSVQAQGKVNSSRVATYILRKLAKGHKQRFAGSEEAATTGIAAEAASAGAGAAASSAAAAARESARAAAASSSAASSAKAKAVPQIDTMSDGDDDPVARAISHVRGRSTASASSSSSAKALIETMSEEEDGKATTPAIVRGRSGTSLASSQGSSSQVSHGSSTQGSSTQSVPSSEARAAFVAAQSNAVLLQKTRCHVVLSL
eukprot:TRINITY_DN6394_c0_g2_i2.p1 TRINITY_DN6394_c0_g2~~TRINITY_DN6394_c0_g2_i2.p1  ORF type:complete len:421 (-),score=107.54 TRINITY_DN6394_c0_g2_i2:127-1389(-)